MDAKQTYNFATIKGGLTTSHVQILDGWTNKYNPQYVSLKCPEEQHIKIVTHAIYGTKQDIAYSYTTARNPREQKCVVHVKDQLSMTNGDMEFKNGKRTGKEYEFSIKISVSPQLVFMSKIIQYLSITMTQERLILFFRKYWKIIRELFHIIPDFCLNEHVTFLILESLSIESNIDRSVFVMTNPRRMWIKLKKKSQCYNYEYDLMRQITLKRANYQSIEIMSPYTIVDGNTLYFLKIHNFRKGGYYIVLMKEKRSSTYRLVIYGDDAALGGEKIQCEQNECLMCCNNYAEQTNNIYDDAINCLKNLSPQDYEKLGTTFDKVNLLRGF